MMPFPIEKMIVSFVPLYEIELFDTQIGKIEPVTHIGYEELLEKGFKMRSKRTSTVTKVNVNIPFPYSGNRKNYQVSSFEYDPEKKVLFNVVKPCLHSINQKYFEKQKGDFYKTSTRKKKENSKFIYIFNFFFFILQKLDDNRTLFSYIHLSDMNIPSNTYLTKILLGNRGNILRNNLISHITSKPTNYYGEIKEKFEKDPYSKQVLLLEIDKIDEDYQKKFEKKVNYTNIEKIHSQKKIQNNMVSIYDEETLLKKLSDLENIIYEEFELMLFHVCINNDLDSFLILIKDKRFDIEIKFKNFNFVTLIHLTAKHNSLDIFKKLVEMGRDINEEDYISRKPIHIVSLMGHREFLLYLIKNKCDINSKDSYGYSPIHFSIINYNYEIIKDLILFGADINMKKNDSTTVLHDLIKSGLIESFKLLLSSDFCDLLKFNFKDNNGNTPLHSSIIFSKLDFLKILLLQKGVQFDSQNQNGMNIIHLACHYGNEKILSYLLTLKESKSLVDQKSGIGYTPAHYAVNSSSTLCLLKLIDYDSLLLNSQDNNGDTPLHLAIRKKNVHLIYYLSTTTDLSLSNKKNEVLKNLMKKCDIKSFIENNFFIY
jgi:ankyrin repeat protein